jgi:hypothetical protein
VYKITKRKATFEDFLKLKKVKPASKMRQDSKAVNFG